MLIVMIIIRIKSEEVCGMTTIYLQVFLRKIVATVIIDISDRSYDVVECSNDGKCRACGINGCPPICEIVVAAKDYAYRRRIPKAEVKEVERVKV